MGLGQPVSVSEPLFLTAETVMRTNPVGIGDAVNKMLRLVSGKMVLELFRTVSNGCAITGTKQAGEPGRKHLDWLPASACWIPARHCAPIPDSFLRIHFLDFCLQIRKTHSTCCCLLPLNPNPGDPLN